jgi:hypothetical protein
MSDKLKNHLLAILFVTNVLVGHISYQNGHNQGYRNGVDNVLFAWYQMNGMLERKYQR